ncbi:oligosaccharide flippase family protein [Clostridium sp. UBA1652]|uniref:oligosaccharide flippase family protein n=1 Tax=Clostridium sp. UBA1652 TaxID=1946348 RepID=UPI00257A6F5A|nr:oligosaccharide flippase family protein [Clostridium sp. UBA1652]
MSRKKLFIENFLVYGLGGIISKIVPLIMLPVVTRLMPDTFYYGINDMANIIVSFGSAIAIMGLYDAMFRLFFEKEDENYKKEVCSTAFYSVIGTAIIVFIILIVFKGILSYQFFNSNKYENLLIISALTIVIGSTNTIISAPTRMLNKRKIFLILNTITPIISYSISVPLLLNKMYVMALPLAALISSASMLIIFYLLNKEWFNIKRFKKEHLKDLIKIGLPLMPNFLIYWILNSCDRLMINNIIGTSYVGIYGVGAKVASMSQLIYTAFAGGWQYFAFSTMKDKDQVGMTSRIFEYLGVISFITTIILTVFSELIFNILFEGDYVMGAQAFPYLFLSPLLLMLFQTAANQFLVIKKTWPNFIILSFGAFLNIIINLVLIPTLGVEGAAIATLIGYISSVLVCVIVLHKMKLIEISNKFKLSTLSILIFFIVWRIYVKDNIILSLLTGLVSIIIISLNYKDDINLIVKKLIK